MRVLVIEPQKVPEVRKIDDNLETMQAIVGGYIQTIYPFQDEVTLVVNDEGKLLGLPLNRELVTEDGTCYDIISGTFFIAGTPSNCDHFTSLTEEQIERYSEMFAVPRLFLNLDGQIMILPMTEDCF